MHTLLKLYKVKVDHKTNQEMRKRTPPPTHTHTLNKIIVDFKYYENTTLINNEQCLHSEVSA